MIIFDLDGTLADCEHRRHFVDASKNPDYEAVFHAYDSPRSGFYYINKNTGKEDFKPNWKSFYESCDKDIPIEPVIDAFKKYWHSCFEIKIWSGRCESVRNKTLKWLNENIEISYFNSEIWFDHNLKMRPIGDNTPDDVLKESWLDSAVRENRTIQFVFDDRPKVVRMWKRRGIFVFNCQQNEGEF